MLARALATLALFALAACASPATRTAAPAAIQLYAMDCGRIHVSDADSFADDGSFKGQARDLIVPCYLIRHPRGDLIWDTGLPTTFHDHPEGVDAGEYHMTLPITLAAQLAQLNIAPDAIDFLSLSHSHFDHVGAAALFTHATWIVDANERAWMFRTEARVQEEFPLIAPLEQMQTTQITGDGDYDVFGDGSVVIVQAPGHTPGHCVLLVRLAHAGPVILSGDLWHLEGSRERRTVPTYNTDRAQTLASMDKIEALAARLHARVIREHVPADFASLPAFPAALD